MEFLAEYGQADRRYEKIVTIAGYTLLAAIVLGSIYWLFFRNWQEERRVDQFLSLLEQKSYEQAYGLWGCSIEKPCPNYSYQKFLEDWGPASPLGPVDSYQVGRSFSQESGVIILVQVNGQRTPNLWVEKDNRVIGFSPY
jgi:hypothetical protein